MTKQVSEATRAMLAAMREDATVAPDSDQLSVINKHVTALRDAEMDKTLTEERLTEINKGINDLRWSKIPQAMDEAGISNITLKAEGNLPPFTVKIDDEYKANIPEPMAEEAYEYLRSVNSEDLIKTQYIISFGLGEAKQAERFERSLEKAGITFETKRGVPWNTLTAWFRSEHKKQPLSVRAMEVLGASVKRVAKVVKQKEKR